MSIKHVYSDLDNRPDCVEPGVYPATIKDAEEKTSKSSGNDMIAIEWLLENGLLVFDYLTFGPKTAYKVDTFLKSVGMSPEKGETVEINADELIGKRAFIEVKIEPASGDYPAKNKVDKYCVDKGQPKALPEDEDDGKGPF